MYARCSRILEREIEALRGIGELQKQVHDAVFKREWAGFEALLAKASGIGTELEALEEERRTLFSELPGFSAAPDFETGFYRLSVCLPPDEQRDLTAKYRELRMAGRRVRINNENLLAYIAGIRATMAAFIESAFPGRKGRLYARNGAVIPQDMSCMVLNHSL
ncbi:MAG: hypothetical protein LBG07_08120 [Treponema sp.]|jgi:hypothetical protein|nr:hypothetical protein [Treponema sp.]